MKTFVKLVSFFMLGLFFANSAHVFAEIPCRKDVEGLETILDEYRVTGNKIYIQPEQLHITNGGIFIFIQSEQVLVRQLNCDENGIYCLTEHLDKITNKCYNQHPIWC